VDIRVNVPRYAKMGSRMSGAEVNDPREHIRLWLSFGENLKLSYDVDFVLGIDLPLL
jgi:hypothetical protein